MIETLLQHSEKPASDPGTKIPRLGFAGVGWIGKTRLEAIRRSGMGRIVAIMDVNQSAAAEVSSTLDDCHCETTFDGLLDHELDGLVIATPSALHASQSIAALEAGIPVFCQKPLARTVSETAAVIAAARKADRLLGIDLSYRFTSGMIAIRDMISRGELGNIYAVESIFHNSYGPDKPWFYDRRDSGGGCLLDLGTHLVDLVLWSLNFPTVKTATGILLKDGRPDFDPLLEVEDYACASMELSTGAAVQLACSWGAPTGCDARIELNFFGTLGGASFKNVSGSFYEFIAERFMPDRTRSFLTLPPEDWAGRAAISWVEQLGRSSHFDPEVSHIVDVAETLDKLYMRSS